MSGVEKDELSGVETTGHEWDGLKELNHPLPRWWLSVFYATVIWGVAYMIAYPAWPMITTATKGLLGYSSRAELAQELEKKRAAQAPWRDRIAKAELTEIVADEELFRFATRAGAAAYAVNCSQCHGAGAEGAKGYPNLNDDAWLWGGALDEIRHTIAHGVRNDEDDESHWSEMPAFGEILEPEELKSVTQHVLRLGGLEHDAALAESGAVVFEENCSACHGEAGEGDTTQGAPRLSDAIWLFGDDPETIAAQIANPSHGVMPPWGQRLDEVTVKELTVYVHALGGGQ